MSTTNFNSTTSSSSNSQPLQIIVEMLAAALTDRIGQLLEERFARANCPFQLVSRERACELLDCSPDYFRASVEPYLPAVLLPSAAGSKRQFKKFDVADLKPFVMGRKRESVK